MTAAPGNGGLGPIFGGVTLASNGRFFVSTRASSSVPAKVRAYNANETVKWTWSPPGAVAGNASQDFFRSPVLHPDGQRLYVAGENGRVYCLAANSSNPSDPTVYWQWPPVGQNPIGRVRAQLSLDISSDGQRNYLYVHSDDGWVYQLQVNLTAPFTWKRQTFNTGPSPLDCGDNAVFSNLYLQPSSSGPVVDSAGNVFVGSSNGHVYGFSSTGAQMLDENLCGYFAAPLVPVEASPAIGPNDWLYVGTRRFEMTVDNVPTFVQALVCINRSLPGASKVQWHRFVATDHEGRNNSPSIICAPILDNLGHVYATEFTHVIEQLNSWDGALQRQWQHSVNDQVLRGKLCQTPTLTESGLLIVGTSTAVLTLCAGGQEDFTPLATIEAIRITAPESSPPLWTIEPGIGLTGGLDYLGSPAIACNGRI